MRRATSVLLGVVGVVCMVLFAAFDKSEGAGRTTGRVGRPDAWFVWEQHPNGRHRWAVDLVRWSAGLRVAGVYCLFYAARLTRRHPSAPPPGA